MKSDLWNIGILIYMLLTKIECKYEEIEYKSVYYKIISELLKVNKEERIEFDNLIKGY